MKALITGGCGFIGHHVVKWLIDKTEWDIIIVDKLSYASFGLQRLKEIGCYPHQRISVFTYDLVMPFDDGIKHEIGDVDYIIHMAAETHVDNSISDPEFCVKNNVGSTLQLLEYGRSLGGKLKKFLYFSTDEVFGAASKSYSFKESDSYIPSNPYSASKAASEMICWSYLKTFGVPVIICNCMNVFGERQHFEKFIPRCIRSLLNEEVIKIHSYQGCEEAGSRFYIYAGEVASAVQFIIENGEVGEKYNIPGQEELDNLTIAQRIAGFVGKDMRYVMDDKPEERPGHDLRYALDGNKLAKLGWKPRGDFAQCLEKVIYWTLQNQQWL